MTDTQLKPETRGVTGLSRDELLALTLIILATIGAHVFLIATDNDAEGLARLITLGAMVLGVGGVTNRKVEKIATRQQSVAAQVEHLANGGGDRKMQAAVARELDARGIGLPPTHREL